MLASVILSEVEGSRAELYWIDAFGIRGGGSDIGSANRPKSLALHTLLRHFVPQNDVLFDCHSGLVPESPFLLALSYVKVADLVGELVEHAEASSEIYIRSLV